MPEPENEQDTAADRQDSGKEKSRLPLMVYLVSAAFGLIFMGMYPMMLNMSAIVESEGIGTASVAGTILSCFTIGGMIAGVFIALMGIGSFCSSFFAGFAANMIGTGNPRDVVLFGAGFCAVIGIIWIITKLRPQKA